MGKKRAVVLGSPEEEQLKAEKNVKREQKKLREGLVTEKVAKPETPVVTISHPSPIVEETTPDTKGSKKPVHTRSKAYKAAKSKVDALKTYSLTDGLSLLRQVSIPKFDPTVELHIVLKKEPTTKLSVNLPHGAKASKKVAVATDEFVAKLQDGTADLNLDYLIASPAQMSKLVRFAKLLGPKGLMPNPKTGTVTPHPEETAKKLASDTSQSLKVDKAGLSIHTTVGKLSLKDKELSENISTITSVVSPLGLTKVILKSTISPAIKIQI